MGTRQRLSVSAAIVAVLLLSGCTSAVMEGTAELKDELLAFDIVEDGYESSQGVTLFDHDSFSSIQLDIVEGASADELAELVRYWRTGVDDIDARWSLGLSMPGGDGVDDGYDSFRVSGDRSADDLDAMVRFWSRAGSLTRSASVSIDDYSDTSDGSILLDLAPQESASLHEVMALLQAEAEKLPGRFHWSLDADIPAGQLSVASTNQLPDAHMLDVLQQVARPTERDPGDIRFWAIESEDPFQPGDPLRLNISVYLEPPGVPEPADDSPDAWKRLGDQILADPAAWPAITEVASRLERDETAVTLSFWAWGDQLANLDPFVCPSSGSEDIYGPLNTEVWNAWDVGSFAGACG